MDIGGKVVVFDICGTLYNSNTTFDFLNYSFSRKRSFRFYSNLYNSFVWKAINKILRDYLHFDLTRIIALLFLKGIERKQLYQMVECYYNGFLKSKENTEITDRLRAYLIDTGNRVILLSATIDPVAKVISKHLGCKEFYSTELIYEDGICTGRIKKDLFGGKISILHELGITDNVDDFYTDDFSDVDVLNVSKNKHIIVNKKYKKKWEAIIKEKLWNVETVMM